MTQNLKPITLFSQPCEFIAGAATIDSLPPIGLPEVSFIGRSNAGKSSLVNALIGRRDVARVSQNPGHTKQLNFFNLGNVLMLVDMPGYGYARVSKERKGQWDLLIRRYLSGRPTLKRVCLLIDARRGVMAPDEDFMRLLDDSGVTFQIVLTKIDTLTEQDISNLLPSIGKTITSHGAAHPAAIATSATTKEGIEALRDELTPFAEVR